MCIRDRALVDVAVWHWMYAHPDATPARLREAVVRIAQETWDRYYAPVLGGKGTPLLGIYSHMISYPLYLADYPLGHLIAFQIEEHLQKSGPARHGGRAGPGALSAAGRQLAAGANARQVGEGIARGWPTGVSRPVRSSRWKARMSLPR